MAEELQKIAWDNSRALCEAGAVPRELTLNIGSSDTYGPELTISDDLGTTFYHFPSLERLDDTDTGFSGIALLGVDDTVFDNIEGTDGQSILESIDDLFSIILSMTNTAKLSEISVNSLSTADQTFDIKTGTSFKIKNASGTDFVEITNTTIDLTSDGDLTFNTLSGGDIVLTPSGVIKLFSQVLLGGNGLYLYGDETTDGSWKIIYSAGDLLTQKRVTGSWVTKQTLT